MDNQKIKFVKAKEIQKANIPPANWIINDILPEGLAILAGRPKVGKSWLALQFAISVAGEILALRKFSVKRKKVLYIALEDNERRIQSRLNILMENTDVPDGLLFLDNSEYHSFYFDPIHFIQEIVNQNDDIELIIIDTLGNAIAKDSRKFGLSFQEEYDFLARLQKIALDNQICILLLHHTRKSIADSVYDEIVGTTGITASPDTLMILKKYQTIYMLHITGRDVREENYQIEQNSETNEWYITDSQISFASTVERQSIIDIFENDYDREFQVKEIAEKTGRTREATSQLIRKMITFGEIAKGSVYGCYKLVKPS